MAAPAEVALVIERNRRTRSVANGMAGDASFQPCVGVADALAHREVAFVIQ
jgi:hypothetical protein